MESDDADARIVSQNEYAQSGANLITGDITIVDAETVNVNQSVSMVVTAIDGTDITVGFEVIEMAMDGTVTTNTVSGVTLTSGTNFDLGGVTYNATFTANNFTVGDGVVFNTAAQNDGAGNIGVVFNRDGSGVAGFNFSGFNILDNETQNFQFFQLNEDTGDVVNSDLDLIFGSVWRASGFSTPVAVASFNVVEGGNIGEIAGLNTELRDIDRFWDASGNFLLAEPQTITLVQGDGTKAAFTLFENDTIGDVVNKIDAAIRNEKTNFTQGTIEVGKGLGQGELVSSGEGEFAYFVQEADVEGQQARVEGTIVINSAITGQQGEIQFVGDEDIIKALSLTNIRDSKENQFNITVTDAHSGDAVAENVQVTGNMLVGTVHTNVDVEFDPMANVGVQWQGEDANAADNSWVFTSESHSYETFVHLADNTMVFHIGANPLQDVAAGIADMRARALGVHNVQVTDRDSANRAIAQIDSAIERVSAERSKMGALQNRLDHTINNLMVASENLTAAESRIRDVDMAAEMMEFTKNQILMQAGTSMLAQANMRPQSVLQLLG